MTQQVRVTAVADSIRLPTTELTDMSGTGCSVLRHVSTSSYVDIDHNSHCVFN
jgi:hypothetical protein